MFGFVLVVWNADVPASLAVRFSGPRSLLLFLAQATATAAAAAAAISCPAAATGVCRGRGGQEVRLAAAPLLSAMGPVVAQ